MPWGEPGFMVASMSRVSLEAPMKKLTMVALAACTPREERIATGAGLGAAGGALIGGLAAGTAGGALAGAAIGGVGGAIIADATR